MISTTNERQDIPGPPSLLATPAIEAVWRAAVEQLGFAVVRTNEAYATSDGRGAIAIGVDAALDGDDAFAQLVFHELCHAITQGQAAMRNLIGGSTTFPSTSFASTPACGCRRRSHRRSACARRWPRRRRIARTTTRCRHYRWRRAPIRRSRSRRRRRRASRRRARRAPNRRRRSRRPRR